MEDNNYGVVIGAANIDIGGTPYKPLIPGDSNPGVIKMSYGGVGRNIAHNLALLGINAELVTATGNDPLGMEMLKNCEKIGMDTSLSVMVPDASSSVYLFINDEKGEMDLALSHVDIVNHITPEYIESISDVINSASIVIADCNLSQETILKIKETCKVPLYADLNHFCGGCTHNKAGCKSTCQCRSHIVESRSQSRACYDRNEQFSEEKHPQEKHSCCYA